MQFGVWSALAIHDTSSVVGAAMQYGARALEIATTIKLTRALWIVPVTLIIGMVWNRGSDATGAGRAKRPWFILGFLAAAAVVTWPPRWWSGLWRAVNRLSLPRKHYGPAVLPFRWTGRRKSEPSDLRRPKHHALLNRRPAARFSGAVQDLTGLVPLCSSRTHAHLQAN
jgi:Conserved hypothetical protein 698